MEGLIAVVMLLNAVPEWLGDVLFVLGLLAAVVALVRNLWAAQAYDTAGTKKFNDALKRLDEAKKFYEDTKALCEGLKCPRCGARLMNTAGGDRG